MFKFLFGGDSKRNNSFATCGPVEENTAVTADAMIAKTIKTLQAERDRLALSSGFMYCPSEQWLTVDAEIKRLGGV